MLHRWLHNVPLHALGVPLALAAITGCQGVIGDAPGATSVSVEPAALQPPVLPRLTEKQYRNALLDLFGKGLPEVAVQDALGAGRLCALRTPFLQPFLQRRLSLLLPRGRYRGTLLEAFLRAVTELAFQRERLLEEPVGEIEIAESPVTFADEAHGHRIGVCIAVLRAFGDAFEEWQRFRWPDSAIQLLRDDDFVIQRRRAKRCGPQHPCRGNRKKDHLCIHARNQFVSTR